MFFGVLDYFEYYSLTVKGMDIKTMEALTSSTWNDYIGET